ncbi:GNAT family N-acetyltransferase [Angustibacter sp. McL0619]|uniref:GNAT family N-acetyltransferase n=1 Tax=Angustibacter sp. McL0619 TaxID=3415676 RepID=UPI003CF1E112
MPAEGLAGLVIRAATQRDVPAVVALIYDDDIAAARESVPGADVDAAYLAAFQQIAANPDDLLVVGELDGRVVACAQVTLLHHLSRRGGTRAQVESVRVDAALRGQGAGGRLMSWIEGYARDRGAALIQLTTDKRRVEARRFYERLGFVASHEGMKRSLR